MPGGVKRVYCEPTGRYETTRSLSEMTGIPSVSICKLLNRRGITRITDLSEIKPGLPWSNKAEKIYCHETGQFETFKAIAELLGRSKSSVTKAIKRRGLEEIKKLSELDQAKGKRVDGKPINVGTDIISIVYENGNVAHLTTYEICSEIKRIYGVHLSTTSLRRKWLCRGAKEEVRLIELLNKKEVNLRYIKGRAKRKERFPPISSTEAIKCHALAAAVINDAVLDYVSPSETTDKRKLIEDARRREAATQFLFSPKHSMRDFWTQCLSNDLKVPRKAYIDANKAEIYKRLKGLQELG
jgi:hypothetical protein